jgi:hypothetical protein
MHAPPDAQKRSPTVWQDGGAKSQTPGKVNGKESDTAPIDYQGWPDLHDHISQLADAGVLPDLEDYA